MKVLTAEEIRDAASEDLEQLESLFSEKKREVLEFRLWSDDNGYKPKVSFSARHTDTCVILKFFVEEKELRACVTTTNGTVWQDSCVEFFISFGEDAYYNFEFNSIGTVLAAFGKNRNERAFLPGGILDKIDTYTKIIRSDSSYYWEILIKIPIEAFVYHSFKQLKGLVARGNFYKCGDGLSQPHYLSWNHIESDVPNFHLPQFFGKIVFE